MYIHQKLCSACGDGKTAEAKRLIAGGAPVDWQNGFGRTPLHEASFNGHTEIVMLLHENKCNLNATDEFGDTPLKRAAYFNKMDTVRALVEAGCDITIRGDKNKTAAEWARQRGYHAIAEYLTNEIRFRSSARNERGQLHRVKGRCKTKPSGSFDRKTRPRAWLDIDINGTRAAYARARAFVEATDLRYGWSSKDLSALGGSERARLPEMYEADFEWKDRGRIALELPPERIVVELFAKECPLAVKNFLALCTGEKGQGSKSSRKLHYRGCRFHRIVAGFVCQGGDFVMGNGSGGESIYGKKFKDDRAGLRLKFDARGLLGMCNTGKNSNSSQFFFTFGGQSKLNGKHVLFGRIIEGAGVLNAIEKMAATSLKEEGKPRVEVVIADCGVL